MTKQVGCLFLEEQGYLIDYDFEKWGSPTVQEHLKKRWTQEVYMGSQ